ncbi:MAG: DUF4203 domain-containing protein [Chthoniobacter sp.]|uniref:TM7S3/TM198-like domain-containing protein n=1 Tax=Chthoniobacter sp. TaxID=2510640 RepID=UPI0032A31C0E
MSAHAASSAHAIHADYLPRELTSLPPVGAILVGVLLLFLGRKLFWLFVGAVGFVAGLELATALLPHQPEWSLIIGLVFGLIGAVIAIFVQKIALGIAGFLVGGYFVMTALRGWEAQAPPEMSWISFLIGGLIGALLMYAVFNWALIILSSISGAHLIVQTLSLTQTVALAAFAVLAIIGIMVQGKMVAAPRAHDA